MLIVAYSINMMAYRNFLKKEENEIGDARLWKEQEGGKISEDVDTTNNGSQLKRVQKEKKSLAGLSCSPFGGPSDEVASEMVFWSDIESDSKYKSPLFSESSTKYITFEPDNGGWNNIRMAMETVLVMAHAMGRTLVLPPDKGMYLLGKTKEEHKKEFGFQDFFHLDSIAVEHEGFDIITMDEFLTRKGITGELKNIETKESMNPPGDQIDWDRHNLNPLWDYLRKVGYYPDGWDPRECVAAIPSSRGSQSVDELQRMMNEILNLKYGPIPNNEKDFTANPTAVDAPAVERLLEFMAGRKKLCIYDTVMQEESLIHFRVGKGSRLLTHFYAFVFFQDWKQDLWSKRFVRDHVRYIDEIMCAAARIINAVRERATALNQENPSNEYDSFHVRRGDFQYKVTRIPSLDLYQRSRDELTEGSLLYIATDERDKSFFDDLAKHYQLTFLDDYAHLIKDINPNYYGMLDQLVAYRGRTFFGTWFSTLSGYVNRMRGYASTKQRWEGYSKGSLPRSFYFIPDEKKYQMEEYRAVKLPIYMREFPVSWRDIDKGIGIMNE